MISQSFYAILLILSKTPIALSLSFIRFKLTDIYHLSTITLFFLLYIDKIY